MVTLPLSKSIINRLLVINHVSGGKTPTDVITDSSDTIVMKELLDKITTHTVYTGESIEINVGNAGTVMRFLTALLAISPGNWIITGTERMQNRPVKPLTDVLLSLGVDLAFIKKEGYPPISINGSAFMNGGIVKLDAGISSQFISALMMIGPVLKEGIVIELQGEIISGSYIKMTQALMQKAGAEVDFSSNIISVKELKYNTFSFSDLAEPDWSAAAFWYEIVALSESARVFLNGLSPNSVQGDSLLPQIYTHLGVKSVFTKEGLLLSKSENFAFERFDYDFTECPDLAQAVIVTCSALGIKGHFSGLKTLRVKETDRIEALRAELSKLGYLIEVTEDQINVNGKSSAFSSGNQTLVVKCYDDHRMAMAFAPLALIHEKIQLDEPEVVKKSYPGFWKDIIQAGFVIEDKGDMNW